LPRSGGAHPSTLLRAGEAGLFYGLRTADQALTPTLLDDNREG